MKGPKLLIAGAGEKLQYLAHNYNDNTIRFIIKYPKRLKEEVLCAAAGALINSVDVLHSSFVPGNLSAHWHVNQDVEPVDYFSLIETDGDPMGPAKTEALRSTALEGKSQLHCTLIQGKESSVVVFLVSHLCADGTDGKYLLNKLAEAYNRISQEGTAQGLEIKNGSRAPEKVYEELSAKEFLSLMKSPLTGVKTMFPFRNKEHSYLKLNYVLISKELFLQARQKAKKIEATANDILLTACYRSYALLDGVQESDAMSIMSMMDLRQHCKENESLGLCNMSGSLPTLLKDGVWGNFSDTLKEIVLQTKKAKEDPLAGLEGMPLLHGIVHTMPMWLMLQAAGLVYSSLSLSLTNLGNISCQELAMDGAVPIEGIFAGPLKKKPSMQISAASFDGTPALAVVGDYTKEDALLIQSILDGMVKEITDYIAEEK